MVIHGINCCANSQHIYIYISSFSYGEDLFCMYVRNTLFGMDGLFLELKCYAEMYARVCIFLGRYTSHTVSPFPVGMSVSK